MKRAPHSPDSPDLVPSDFDLLVYIKQCRSSCAFADTDSLLQAVSVWGILDGIDTVTLAGVFSDWMKRLGGCRGMV
jgi:hypothetical protein